MVEVSKPNPIPQTYRRVTPCLIVRGAAKAMEFYAQVFGATERMRFPGPDGSVAHAEIQIGDSVVIVKDKSPYLGTTAPPSGGLGGSPVFQFIYVEDVDAVVARAVELGATVKRGPGSVLRRPGRLHRRPVRARLDGRVACRRRGTR
jgi:PhnB protein